MSVFSKRLCQALIMRNMTAAELSQTLGINEGTISQYKKGLYTPKLKRTQAIAEALRTSVDWLMGADIPMNKTEQTQDELVFMELEKAIKSARQKAKATQAAERIVFSLLDSLNIDADNTPSEAENADNLSDTISCYIQYGEYSIPKIMREVRSAYSKTERKDNQ